MHTRDLKELKKILTFYRDYHFQSIVKGWMRVGLGKNIAIYTVAQFLFILKFLSLTPQ